MNQLRGKVVILQSWTSRDSRTFESLQAVAETVRDVGGSDAVLIGLHTPPGASDALIFSARHPFPCPVAIDKTGAFCDQLGVYTRPVTMVIDRSGVMRYVGLNQTGLASALPLRVD